MAERVIIPEDMKLGEFIMGYVHDHGYPNHKSGGYAPIIVVRAFSDKNVGRVLVGERIEMPHHKCTILNILMQLDNRD